MLLPFTDDLVESNQSDIELCWLADRHYSRKKHGSAQFVGPGRQLVLRDALGDIVFAWLWAYDNMRLDGQTGYNCTIFRNESSRRSSEVILEAEQAAIRRWGPNRMFTYINSMKIRSPNPGYCFKVAGWRYAGQSQTGLHLLVKERHDRIER
jgi:hypothetical protein